MGSTGNDEILFLIRGCARQERESQKLLYKHFYGYAMSICLRYSFDQDEAIEILNDGFLKIFKNMEKYSEELSFKGWLRRIMINTALDHFRKNKKHYKNKGLDQAEEISTGETIMSRLNYLEIIGMIQNLTPGYRAVFNLYVIDGYNHEEISKKLGISVGTSKSNLAKARMNLQEMLKKNYQNEQTKYPC